MARAIAALFGLVVLGVIAVETASFVKQHIASAVAPLLAAALAVALVGALVYFLWHVAADPSKRLGERTRDEIDYRVQRSRVASELQRRIAAVEEEQRIRALTATARVHERAARAVSDGKMQLELEELKGRSEQVVMRAQSADVARLLARYEAAFWKLNAAEHMSASEKARLLREMHELLAAPAAPDAPPRSENARVAPQKSAPAKPSSLFARKATPPEMLEYRARGGQGIPITVSGLRRLRDREQLEPDDECRQVGASEWIAVNDFLDAAPPR
jgi:hypothetical protein